MSLYNMIHGVNPATFFILPVLENHPDKFPRFRNAFVGDPEREDTTGKLIVYTRTGGGNREYYEAENLWITELPGFLFDYDDSFDSTYACWVFDIPEKWQADVNLSMNGEFTEVSDEYVELLVKVFPQLDEKIRANLRPAAS